MNRRKRDRTDRQVDVEAGAPRPVIGQPAAERRTEDRRDAPQRGEQPLVSSLRSEDAVDPEQEALARERENILRDALMSLRRAYREAVILRDVEGFTYDEIAVTLKLNIGTVKSRIARGRLELRRKLEGSL